MLGQYRASSKERKVSDCLVAITAVCMRGEGGGERGGLHVVAVLMFTSTINNS